MFSLLRKWLGLTIPQRADLHFAMYTRRDCHLCAAAWKLLTAHQQRRGFTLVKIDVDSASDLVAKFGNCVPVVVVNGVVRFRGVVNDVLLQRILDAKP